MGDTADRDAILKRRLQLIASALSGLTLSSVAHGAPAPEACNPTTEPSESDQTQAKTLIDQGLKASETGSRVDATRAFLEAYRLVPAATTAKLAASSLHSANDAFAAFVLLAEHLLCFGDLELLADAIEALERGTGGLRMNVTGDLAWQLQIDDRAVPQRLQTFVIRLSPGKHRITFVPDSPKAPSVREIDIAIGETTTIDESSVKLFPCLSPPPPPDREETLLEFDFGPSPLAAIDTRTPERSQAGIGLRQGIAIQFADDAWLHAHLAGGFLLPELRGFAFGAVDLRYQVTSFLAFGAGFFGGFSKALPFEPRAAWGPTIIPLAIDFGTFRIDLCVPIWFDAYPARGPQFIAPRLFTGFGWQLAQR